MSTFCHADYDSYTDPFYLYIISIGIVFILQLLLFVHTIYTEISQQENDEDCARNLRLMRILYVVIQILALYWIFMGIITSEPPSFIVEDPFCGITAYSVYYIPGLFYGGYLIQMLYRVESAFKNSCLALSARNIYILRTLVLSIPIVSTISLIVDDPNMSCIRSWDPPDIDRPIPYCVVPYDLLLVTRYYIFHGCVVLINVMNFVFAVIFSLKLFKFIKMIKTSDSIDAKQQWDLEELILKNNILAVIGCISTTTGFVLYNFTSSTLFMLFDSYFNSLIIGLMFKWNVGIYRRLCSPCIMLYWRYISKSPISSPMDLTAVDSQSQSSGK